jgi:hypothetical protein
MYIPTGIQAREAVHVLLLRELNQVVGGSATTLKGGVNLRLFWRSVRYSEDMDLDGDSEFSMAIRSRIRSAIEEGRLLRDLRLLGLRGIDPGEGPNKDTDTVFRYKFNVLGGGDVRYSTKVEVSFRPRHPADVVEQGPADRSITDRYLPRASTINVSHYGRLAAKRQKLVALSGRTIVQARDVFDLHVLGLHERQSDWSELAAQVDASTLASGLDRALEISYPEFEGQVVEFLSDEARRVFGDRLAWEGIQLMVAQGIEGVISTQEGSP